MPPARMTSLQVSGNAVARVNGVALSDRDLVREMFAIFPYAKQHNGFPEKLEPQIRKGALDMIVFEELVYQEAKRRNMTISDQRLAREERDFRKQFPSDEVFNTLETMARGEQNDAVRRSAALRRSPTTRRARRPGTRRATVAAELTTAQPRHAVAAYRCRHPRR